MKALRIILGILSACGFSVSIAYFVHRPCLVSVTGVACFTVALVASFLLLRQSPAAPKVPAPADPERERLEKLLSSYTIAYAVVFAGVPPGTLPRIGDFDLFEDASQAEDFGWAGARIYEVSFRFVRQISPDDVVSAQVASLTTRGPLPTWDKLAESRRVIKELTEKNEELELRVKRQAEALSLLQGQAGTNGAHRGTSGKGENE